MPILIAKQEKIKKRGGSMSQFLNFGGLSTFLTQLRQFFASTSEVAEVEADTETYVLNIDYESTLAFDTKEIITDKEDA